MDESGCETSFSSLSTRVEFLDVQDHYSYNQDLICKYRINGLKSKENDRVAIYTLGWKDPKEYVLFEWAPIMHDDKIVTIVFNRPSLPRNTSEIYQFCYVTIDNEVYGASSPFQFVSDTSKVISMSFISCSRLSSLADDCNKEIEKLREENALLKKTLNAVVNERDLDKDVREMKSIVKALQQAFITQQHEIQELKNKLNERHIESQCTVKPRNKVICDIGDLETLPPFPHFEY